MLTRSPSQEELRKLALESLLRNKSLSRESKLTPSDARSTTESIDEAEEGEILDQGSNFTHDSNEQTNLENSDDSDFDDLLLQCGEKGNKEKQKPLRTENTNTWDMEEQRYRNKDRKKRRTDAPRGSKPKTIERSSVTEPHPTNVLTTNSNFLQPGFSQPIEIMYPNLIAPSNLNYGSFHSNPFHMTTPTTVLNAPPFAHAETSFPGFSFPVLNSFVPQPPPSFMEPTNMLPTQPFFAQQSFDPMLTNLLQAQPGVLSFPSNEGSFIPHMGTENVVNNHTNGNVPKQTLHPTTAKQSHTQFSQPLIIHVDQLEDSDTDEDHKNVAPQQQISDSTDKPVRKFPVEYPHVPVGSMQRKAKTNGPPKINKRSEIEKLKQLIAQKEQQKKTTKPTKPATALSTPRTVYEQSTGNNDELRPPRDSSTQIGSLQSLSKISLPALILEDLQQRIDRLNAKISQEEQILKNCQEGVSSTEKQLLAEMQSFHDQRTVQMNCQARYQVLNEQLTILESNLRQSKVQESLVLQQLRQKEQIQSERRHNLISLLSSVDKSKLSLCEMEIEWRIAQESQPVCETQLEEFQLKDIAAPQNPVMLVVSLSSTLQEQYHPKPLQEVVNVETESSKRVDALDQERTAHSKRQKLDIPQETKPQTNIVYPSHRELTCFHAYRLNPHFSECTGQRLSSATFANKIDYSKHLCRFELHGVCNNDECKHIHKRDYSMSDEEILKQLAGYKTKNSSEETKKFVDQMIQQLCLDQRLSSEDKCLKLMKTLSGLNGGKAFHISSLVSGSSTPSTQTHDLALSETPLQLPTFLKKYRTSHLIIVDEKPADVVQLDVDEEEVDDIIFNLANYIPISDKSSATRRFNDFECGDTQISNFEQKNRYWAIQSSQDYEKALSEDPHNIVLWLKWAFKLDPPSKIEENKLYVSIKARNRIISILSKALEHNKDNLVLLIVFLHFYLTGATKADIPSLFMKALSHATTRSHYPTLLWHMYLETASSILEKVTICNDAANHVLTFISNNTDSLAWSAPELLVHFMLKSAELQCQSDHIDAAIQYLHDVLLGDDHTCFRKNLNSAAMIQLCLVYIYITAFRTYPRSGNAVNISKHPFHPSFIIDWAIWLKDLRLDLVKQVERAMLDILDHFKTFDILEFVFPLLYNICNLYLAANKYDQAKVLCQQWLKANPNEEKLWLLYAQVEQKTQVSSGQQLHEDAELIYSKSLKRTNSLRVAYYYAKFLKKQGKVHQAIIVLVKPLIKLDPEMATFQDERISSLNFQHSETALSTADIEQAQKVFKHSVSKIHDHDEITQFYLWTNYCLFEELSGNIKDLEACYSRAISVTKQLYHKQYFMCKYLKQKKKQNLSFSELSDLLSKISLNNPSANVCETCACNRSCLPAVEDILPPAGFSSPFLSSILNTYILSHKDFFWQNKSFRICFAELPRPELSSMYDRFLELFPLNTELAIEAIKHEMSGSNFCKAKAILVGVVRTQPNLLGSLSGKELIRLGHEIHHLLNKR